MMYRRTLITLAQRELVRFFRQPHRVIGSLAQPILFWLFLGSGFSPAFKAPGMHNVSYLEYFYPGILLMLLLFTSIFSTITIIEDRNQGLLQEVLVSPAPRLAIVLGKVLGSMAIALLQTFLLLFIAPFIGLAFTWSSLSLIVLACLITSLGFTTLGFLIAWNMESTAGYHAIMSVFLMPLWMLSGALFPVDNAPTWLAIVMTLNPVTHALRLIRMPFYETPQHLFANPSYGTAWLVALIWAAVCLIIALMQVGKQEKGAHLPQGE